MSDEQDERCEVCKKSPAPVYAGDGGLASVWLCEECAAEVREEEA